MARALSDHVRECGEVRKETNRKLDKLSNRLDELNTTAWKAVGALAFIILSAAVSLGVWNYENSRSLDQRTSQSTQAMVAPVIQQNKAMNEKLDQALGTKP